MHFKILFLLLLLFASGQKTQSLKQLVDAKPKENNRGVIKYNLSKLSLKDKSIPQGKIIDMGFYHSTKFYPNTKRRWWVYIPTQYDSSSPTKLLVINDGENFLRKKGNPINVMNNLIATKKMPVTIAVFINPGISNIKGSSIKNRSNEYDTCSPKFATFIEEKILSQVYKKYNISKNSNDRAIMGSSSGGSCAFTAAWHRNDLYSRVISFVGSYCDFRLKKDFSDKPTVYGSLKRADEYPSLVRKLPRKNIRIFIQSGKTDLDNYYGNWYLNNQRLVKALKYTKYNYKVTWGEDGHSSKHGISLLPEIFQWIWK